MQHGRIAGHHVTEANSQSLCKSTKVQYRRVLQRLSHMSHIDLSHSDITGAGRLFWHLTSRLVSGPLDVPQAA